MINIKSYTDIEQSKKLAEILPLESADMRYSPLGMDMHPWIWTDTFIEKDAIPCWSLAALYALLPERTDISKAYSDDCVTMAYWCWAIMSEAEDECDTITETANYDNPIDACVEMISELKEKNLL